MYMYNVSSFTIKGSFLTLSPLTLSQTHSTTTINRRAFRLHTCNQYGAYMCSVTCSGTSGF